MIKLAVRIGVNAAALWAAAEVVDGIDLSTRWASLLFVALVFGLVNAIIKPIARILTFPITILTLGLFTLVVNATMLGLTAWFTDSLEVDGFWPALLGAIVISVVSSVLSIFVPDDEVFE